MADLEKALGSIASTLQIDATEFIAALRDGDDWLPDEDFSAALKARLLKEVKAARAEARLQGLSEANRGIEKVVKDKGFAPDGTLKGTALLEAFAAHMESKVTNVDPEAAKTLTVEDLAKLPEVQRLMRDAVDKFGADAKGKLDALRGEYESFKKMAKAQEVRAVTRDYVARQLETADVLLEPADSGVSKEVRIDTVFKLLNLDEVDVVEEGGKKRPIFIDANGTPLTDPDLGKPIDFGERVVALGQSIYGKRGATPGRSGGAPNQAGASGGNGEYKPTYRFASAEDYSSAWANETDAAKRAIMARDFQIQSEKQAAAT